MRKTDPTKYSQRKCIAKEFVYLGENKGNMKDAHGEAVNRVGQFIRSIRQKILERKQAGLQVHESDSGDEDDDDDEDEPEPLLRRRRNQEPTHVHVIQSMEGVVQNKERDKPNAWTNSL
ncbi:hypothetical protein BGZ96_010528 [Linnemannia gamsii]|uniref:Uncharacterized protein n=1 Tax=Linnemannia gamsii TaxID=64522 RepID=A0ABQ7JU28_9FUNG|nr:hypothetical protein BGZ96_010528 [Linnemannia gamsii]